MYDSWKLAFLYDPRRNEVVVDSFEVRDSVSGERIAGYRKQGSWSFTGLPKAVEPKVDLHFHHFVPVFHPKGRKPEASLARRVTLFAFDLQMRFSSLQWQFERLTYVGPIREKIPRYGILGTMPFSELTPSGQNLMRVLSSTGRGRGRKSLVKQLNRWLDRKFGMLKDVRIVNLDEGGLVKTLVARDRTGRTKINLAATGAGISQIVPVVVQTLSAPKDGCLIVEQPEIHLHPGAQTTLADLFIENLKDRRQYIVETHSEHFVLRVRRRVAEGRARPDDVRIMFVEKPRGETRIQTLRLTTSGHLSRWPKGFFDEGYREAMALAEAGSRR